MLRPNQAETIWKVFRVYGLPEKYIKIITKLDKDYLSTLEQKIQSMLV